jgi:hypothetical protein
VRDMYSFLTEYSSSVVLVLHAIRCHAAQIRVVPGSHRVVGPGTHRGSGPKEVHTTSPRLWYHLKDRYNEPGKGGVNGSR